MDRIELAGRLAVDLLRGGGTVRLPVTGHSMTPCIRRGDVVTVAPLRGRDPRVGEVLAVAPEGRLCLHRLVGCGPEGALVRGDLATCSDPFIPPDAVLGVVVAVERSGRPVRAAGRPELWGLALLSRLGLVRAAARLRERLRR